MKISMLTRSAGRFLARRGRRQHLIDGLVVDVIDDPLGPMCLVRVIGALDERRVGKLFDALSHGTPIRALHLDLHDAVIVDDAAMTALERAVDHLEVQLVGIRIVGVDPYHPALAH